MCQPQYLPDVSLRRVRVYVYVYVCVCVCVCLSATECFNNNLDPHACMHACTLPACLAPTACLPGELTLNPANCRAYGPLPGRENWGDPMPPRPPILATGGTIRPTDSGHFWRSA